MFEGREEKIPEYFIKAIVSLPVLLALFLLLHTQNLAIVTSIGSTTFLVFAMTKNKASRPKHIIGGHIIGIFSGFLISFLPQTVVLSSIIPISLAVSISIFLMLVFDVGHPPAAGTALGMAVEGLNYPAVGGIIISAILLSITRESIIKLLSKEINYFG